MIKMRRTVTILSLVMLTSLLAGCSIIPVVKNINGIQYRAEGSEVRSAPDDAKVTIIENGTIKLEESTLLPWTHTLDFPPASGTRIKMIVESYGEKATVSCRIHSGRDIVFDSKSGSHAKAVCEMTIN